MFQYLSPHVSPSFNRDLGYSLGATVGSSASTSKLKWVGLSRPGLTWSKAISTTFPIPYLSTSCIVNALMPFSFRIFRSPASMSRRPMYTLDVASVLLVVYTGEAVLQQR